ncbi:MAG TPA: hypothetical protein VJ925_14470 [Longimicrobiales bacterium]|nr:hypothetical protein [Longimicrobiales bacterium]
MAQSALDVASPEIEAGPDSPLYRHSKRPQWGIGILIRESEKARTYQFEGGRRRKIRKGYYKLLKEVEDLGQREELIRENLLNMAEAPRDTSKRKVLEPAAPFEEQVELFLELYPEGFQDPEWIEDHRETDGRALKRHRTPISKEAQEALSAERCEEAVAAGNYEEFGETIADILSRTDLVPISFAKALRGLSASETRKHVEAVVRLLHGEGRHQDRFRNYVLTLKELFEGRPRWRTATVLPALVYPNEHTVVRRSAFIRQAAVIAPAARYSRRARAGSYGNFLRVAQRVRERLTKAGHEPRDLLDVYDFVWATLRTSALEHLGDD